MDIFGHLSIHKYVSEKLMFFLLVASQYNTVFSLEDFYGELISDQNLTTGIGRTCSCL